MTEIAQRLTMGSNVSAPVVLSKIRKWARQAGNITAIVRGKNNTTGNALLEVYTLSL